MKEQTELCRGPSIRHFQMQHTEEPKEGEVCGGFPWGGESMVGKILYWGRKIQEDHEFIVTRAALAIVLHCFTQQHHSQSGF
jgi:hypothetical protein